MCDDDGCNDFSIRKLWDADSKILTIGWYNMKSHGFNDDDGEANFEVQLNFENNEFKIVHGDFGDNFSKSDNNSVFVGFSKDVTCSSLGEDISGCEGKDYVQLFWHNQGYGSFESVDDDFNSTFQNPLMDKPYFNNSLYNSYFHDNQTKNGTEYCFDSGTAANTFSASANCGINYTWNDAKGIETHKHLTRAVPRYIGGGGIKNILLPSNIKQSFAVGTEAEFVWMHLNKPSTILSYTPAEDNASGFEQVGANSNATVTGGVIKSGDSVTTTTFADEIVIGGEVYKDSKLKSFLNNTKKVVAFAPIPVLHTNKYEMSQSPDTTDIRFKHAHTIMPQFISEEFMEDKNNGTDLRFDFRNW